MTSNNQMLARKFAEQISYQISDSEEFRSTFANSAQSEHKLSAQFISEQARQFLDKEYTGITPPELLFDFEGNRHRKRKQKKMYYDLLGTSAFPDSAVLEPFTCAFEFDREFRSGSSTFKTVLMKAAVHVVSGYYDACVLVYVQRPNAQPFQYLEDKSPNTKQLVDALQSYGLYVSFVIAG